MDIKVSAKIALVFDLDDTLYNEIDFLKSAYQEISIALEPENWKALLTNIFSRYRNKKDVFEYLFETYGVSKSKLIEEYRNHFPKIKPFQGVYELMEKVKEHNGKIGIVTDGRSKTQRNKIKALQLEPYIDYIVISEEIGTEKPIENNFRVIEKELNCVSYYYIGDNLKKDFITPKRLDWTTIGLIDNGLNIHSNAFEYQKPEFLPHHFITSIAELNII